MILEINLWLNPGAKYNGAININRGEQSHKFSQLKTYAAFVQEAVTKGMAEAEDFDGWDGDKEALYAWLPDCQFVSWNTKREHMECFLQGSTHRVPLNKTYDRSVVRSKFAPTMSFRTSV